MAKHSAADKAEALAKLREWFPKGSTVYTILRNVSRSGMGRTIGVVGLLKGDEPHTQMYFIHPNHAVSVVLDYTLKRDGVYLGGCGMDMGFHLVNSLGYALWYDGYALKHEWL